MATPDTRPESLWWVHDPPAFPTLAEALETEVLIVGGGITGTTLAWTLAEQDCATVLLDAGPLAGEASGRNAGFLMAAPAEPYEEMIALWGRAGARAVLETGRRSHQRIRQIVETLGIACDYRVRGSLRLACSDDEAADFRASLPALAADGFPMEEWESMRAAPLSASRRFDAGFFTAEDGELHPVRFLHGLARAAHERGARIHERSPVLGAVWQAGRWEAYTPAGTVGARILVLATNAYAPRLCEPLGRLIAPRRGQMLSTAPLDREVAPCPTYANWGYHYWRQLPDGRLVIGGWRDLDLDGEVGYETRPTPRIQTAIEHGLRDIVPEGAPIERRWAGTMGFARDGRPLVGWLDATHHLALCAGMTGHGMGMAAALTQDLADLLAFRPAPGIATYDPGRFKELQKVREGITSLGDVTGELSRRAPDRARAPDRSGADDRHIGGD
ncbi:MAG TPA: FAD-dependent oxidoreductase [Candidatus Eisenbacteria bacterium]